MATATETIAQPSSTASPWWDRIDHWCEQFGDALNPILVKETRQALKSRQFVMTFSVLLFAALGWTIVGSLMMMPQIYTSPSAPWMLTGYYVVLAVPLLMVVPLAAYRSLEGEIDDGTLELLSITTLSPWQIVLGKLASASLQMLLYFVALFPCVAYAYTLRGVDLPTTLLMVAMLIVGALLLTVIALFFAPLARTRTGRIATLLAVMMILLFAEYFIGLLAISMIQFGNPLPTGSLIYIVVATLILGTAIGHLLLTATAAQLTPESENRSTSLRLSLLALVTVGIGVAAYGMQTLDRLGEAVFLIFAMALGGLWAVGSCLMVAESANMTPRIRRELPSSFLARLTLTWVTPGPGTGLVFATVGAVLLAALAIVGIDFLMDQQPGRAPFAGRIRNLVEQLSLLSVSYLVAFLVIVRWIVALVRINNHPRAEIGIAAFVAVAVVFSLVPYSIGLHVNDYRNFDYSRWQITNWAWTIVEAADGKLAKGEEYYVAAAACAIFLFNLLLMPTTVLPRRTATPARVQEELAATTQRGV
jgi:ABC-type transport system involved in cytochrome c biogenesis permease component